MRNGSQAREKAVNPAIARKIGPELTELIEEVRISGEEWGRLKARVEYLGHFRKIRLAELIDKYFAAIEMTGDKASVARAEEMARKDPEYKKIVMQLYKSQVEESRAMSWHFAKRNAMDVLFAKMNLERAEMYMNKSA